jgi:hypothetical protein
MRLRGRRGVGDGDVDVESNLAAGEVVGRLVPLATLADIGVISFDPAGSPAASVPCVCH